MTHIKATLTTSANNMQLTADWVVNIVNFMLDTGKYVN